MGSVPYAFSVHHFINSVGAGAGFAAIIGLAILVLLHFAQARETSALRDQAQEWAQHVQQLEARLTLLSRGQASARTQPPAPPPPGFRTAANRIGAGSPGAPAAAQASARAEAAVPSGASAHLVSASLVGKAASPGASAGVAAPAVTGKASPPGAPAGVAAPALTAATKLPPVPESGNGAASERVPPPASYAGSRPAAGDGSPGVPRAQVAASAPGPRPAVPLGDLGLEPAPTRRIPGALVVLLTGLVIAAVVAGLVLVTSNSSNSATPTAAPNANAGARRQSTSAAGSSPSSVTVAVLNGTATSGLAAHVSQRLVGDGYKQGMVGNAADETHASTVVAYRPGNERGALAVARSLGLSNASVQQVDQGTLQIACSPPSPCATSVVVTVGADLATTAQ